MDVKTNKKKYRRQVTDIEEIPLFYEFWFPAKANFGLVAFQSFQGRSCIQLVVTKVQEEFELDHEKYALRFRKVLPSDKDGSLFSKYSVKKLHLIKRNVSSDIADKYTGYPQAEAVDFEVSVIARPRKHLASFGDLLKSMKKPQGVVMYDGVEFTEAVAEIRVGNRLRRVEVFGGNSDAGVIDVTDDVTKGTDGHPTFDSLAKESAAILEDIHATLSGSTL